MAHSQRAERTFTRFSAEAPPDLLPAGWQGIGCRSLEIDVGCHKGRFLVEMAQRYPVRNFLGIERQRERAERAKKKISLLGLGNAEVLHGDGLEIIGCLPDACADCVHILFPDPWPKRRHKSRRMVQEKFLLEVQRILKFQGLLQLVTDDADYAREMEFAIANIAAFQRTGGDLRDYPPTEFQIKFLADSRPVYGVLLERVN
jgi:tRNA (guanine-N7-)-methyltransferase